MYLSTRREYIWSSKQNRYILVQDFRRPFFGQVAWAKGASAQQTDLANSQQNFYNTLSNDYNQQFANQSAILSSLNNSLSPIVAAGPNQFGFNQSELNTLNSQAITGTGQQYNNAAKALGAQQAAQGGGNSYLPTGAQSAQQAGLAAGAANQASNQLLGVQEAGYQAGRNQYNAAIGQLGGVAGMYNPTGFSNSANSAGGVANSEANTVTQLNNAASPWNLVGGILGGAASAFSGGLFGGLGSSLASGISGGGGGGWANASNTLYNAQYNPAGAGSIDTTSEPSPYL